MIQTMNWLSPYPWAGEAHAQSERPLQVMADVKFGQPSKNCHDSGICEVELLPSNTSIIAIPEKYENSPCNKGITCLLSVYPFSQAYLELAIPKSSLNAHCRKKQLTKAGFKVTEDYQLPDDLCEALQLRQAVITKGLHPYWEGIGMLIVRLPLSTDDDV
jgi:hypothetical protein